MTPSMFIFVSFNLHPHHAILSAAVYENPLQREGLSEGGCLPKEGRGQCFCFATDSFPQEAEMENRVCVCVCTNVLISFYHI